MRIFTFFMMAAGLGMMILSGCGDKEESNVLELKFNHQMGSEALVYGNSYQLDGKLFVPSLAMMYLSDVVTYDDAGGVIERFSDQYLLLRSDETAAYEIGEIESDHLHRVSFDLGVSEEINHGDPAVWEAGHPLASQTPSMYWGWDSGYIFLKLEGQIDTDADGETDSAVLLHIGKDELLKNIDLMTHADASNGKFTVNVDIDYTKLFDGLTITEDSATRSTHTGNNLPLAEAVADNFAAMFSIVE